MKFLQSMYLIVILNIFPSKQLLASAPAANPKELSETLECLQLIIGLLKVPLFLDEDYSFFIGLTLDANVDLYTEPQLTTIRQVRFEILNEKLKIGEDNSFYNVLFSKKLQMLLKDRFKKNALMFKSIESLKYALSKYPLRAELEITSEDSALMISNCVVRLLHFLTHINTFICYSQSNRNFTKELYKDICNAQMNFYAELQTFLEFHMIDRSEFNNENKIVRMTPEGLDTLSAKEEFQNQALLNRNRRDLKKFIQARYDEIFGAYVLSPVPEPVVSIKRDETDERPLAALSIEEIEELVGPLTGGGSANPKDKKKTHKKKKALKLTSVGASGARVAGGAGAGGAGAGGAGAGGAAGEAGAGVGIDEIDSAEGFTPVFRKISDFRLIETDTHVTKISFKNYKNERFVKSWEFSFRKNLSTCSSLAVNYGLLPLSFVREYKDSKKTCALHAIPFSEIKALMMYGDFIPADSAGREAMVLRDFSYTKYNKDGSILVSAHGNLEIAFNPTTYEVFHLFLRPL